MMRLTDAVYARTPARARVIIEQVGGEMSLMYEGIDGGWGVVHEVLLKAASEAARQAVLEDRQRRETLVQVPQILVPGERV
jgi:hypothetical protein